MDRLSLKLLPEEHRVLRALREQGVMGRRLLVAVSGGRDSIVTLAVLQRLQPIVKNQISVAYVHHGSASGTGQQRYRTGASKFVEQLAKSYGLKFLTNKVRPQKKLHSEADLRLWRLALLQKWQKKILADYVVFGHHADDCLETQMINLIRGTGRAGLSSMAYISRDNKLRPLLVLSSKEVQTVADKLQLKWKEDPSNKEIDPFRNWLRRKWLPLLEKKRPGSLKSLQRSLDQVFANDEKQMITITDLSRGFTVKSYLSLTPDEQRHLLVSYLRHLGVRDYGVSHVQELRRRLDIRRGQHKFTLLRREWQIKAGRVIAR